MGRRRSLKGALESFLGTLTSRNSDYRGFWVFGMIHDDLGAWTVDLLGPESGDDSSLAAARDIAIRRFAEQVRKYGLDMGVVREAELTTTVAPEAIQPWKGLPMGHLVTFRASATTDTGFAYSRERTAFVAPHNPDGELRRLPSNWGI